MIKTLAITVATAVFISGCAGPSIQPPNAYDVDHTESYAKEFDEVWEKTVDWFAVNNIPIKNIEKDSGIIGSEYSLGSDYSQVDCGVLDAGNLYLPASQTVVANINVLVRSAGPNTTVKPNVFGQGNFQLVEVLNNRQVSLKADRCITTGELEEDLHDYLRSNL